MTDKHNHDTSKLIRQIERAELELVEKRTVTGDEEDGMAVLFTGNWHTAFPRQLVVDQALSTNDKVTWQVIRLSITDPSRPGSTPRRDELASMVNCSAPTVTTSRTMLRVCRWMTFCKTVRNQGRFIGDIFLFNDEPMSLASTLAFDRTYIPFLQQQATSATKRIRKAAALILREIDLITDINQPTELERISHRLTKKTIAQQEEALVFHRSKNFAPVSNPVNGTESSKDSLENLDVGLHSKNFAMDGEPEKILFDNQSKNFAPVENNQSKFLSPVKIFFPYAHGSNNNYINNKNISNAHVRARDKDEELTSSRRQDNPNPNPTLDPEKTFTLAIESFPVLASHAIKFYVILMFAMRENQLPVIQRILERLPEPDRTDVLCQIIGRQASSHHGWARAPLHNPIAFAGELVRRCLSGDFFPDEWALELKKSIATGEEPFFIDSPELRRNRRSYGEYESEG